MNYQRSEPATTSKHVPGGAAVVIAIMGEKKILLIKETTKPRPHFWKFVGETVEPGEPILNALWGGVREEAGLELEARRVGGKVVEIIDPRIKVTRQLLPPHWVQSHTPHKRHFWGLMTTDEVVLALSGKHHTGDVNEEIDTLAFDLSELDKMPDFHPQHRKLIGELQRAG